MTILLNAALVLVGGYLAGKFVELIRLLALRSPPSPHHWKQEQIVNERSAHQDLGNFNLG